MRELLGYGDSGAEAEHVEELILSSYFVLRICDLYLQISAGCSSKRGLKKKLSSKSRGCFFMATGLEFVGEDSSLSTKTICIYNSSAFCVSASQNVSSWCVIFSTTDQEKKRKVRNLRCVFDFHSLSDSPPGLESRLMRSLSLFEDESLAQRS